MNHKAVAACVCVSVLLLAELVGAQWVRRPATGIPRTRDGQLDVSAPAPRTADGKIDLSGVWQQDRRVPTATGALGAVLSPYYADVTADLKPEEVPFQPWAEAEYAKRRARLSIDDPAVRCQPYGVPGANAYPAPFKIVQTPGLMLILYEANTTFRQVFLDGQEHPRDPQPTWMGYSIGVWDGDALVVDTIGFNDRSWLDRRGHPHTESMRVTERFRRTDVGHLEIHVTIDDPKAYRRPLQYTQRQELLPASELQEHFCTDNEKFSSQIR